MVAGLVFAARRHCATATCGSTRTITTSIALNPDDSGSVSYSHPSPVVGAVWHVTDDFNVYANYGVGFETPSFIELAYRNVGSGLNFALQPAISKSAEVGIKVLVARTAAAECGDVRDQHDR